MMNNYPHEKKILKSVKKSGSVRELKKAVENLGEITNM